MLRKSKSELLPEAFAIFCHRVTAACGSYPAPNKRMEKLRSLIPVMMPYYEAKGERPVYPLIIDPVPEKKAEAEESAATE